MDALFAKSRLLCLLLVVFSDLCFAATLQNIGQTIRQQQAEIKKEQEILQNEKRQRELKNDFEQLSPKLKPEPSAVPEGPCFTIETVSFVGINDLDAPTIEKIREITQPYVGRCMYLAEMSEIVSLVNRYFLELGLVTTRAFLPEQSLQEGELLIRVIVGRVQSLQSDTLTPRNLSWAFPVESDELLNLRDIEQGLDQINRLSSNRSTIQLIPGENPGESIVGVNNSKSNRFHARVGVTGTSIQNGDDYRGRVDLFADDLMGINYLFVINYNESLADRGDYLSRGAGFDYSFPWHYNLFSLNANRFEYKNVVDGTNQHFDVSSRSLSILRAEVKHKQYVWNDVTLFLNLSIEHGLDLWGADDDDESPYPDKA